MGLLLRRDPRGQGFCSEQGGGCWREQVVSVWVCTLLATLQPISQGTSLVALGGHTASPHLLTCSGSRYLPGDLPGQRTLPRLPACLWDAGLPSFLVGRRGPALTLH